jgi:hypothetical protein
MQHLLALHRAGFQDEAAAALLQVVPYDPEILA